MTYEIEFISGAPSKFEKTPCVLPMVKNVGEEEKAILIIVETALLHKMWEKP